MQPYFIYSNLIVYEAVKKLKFNLIFSQPLCDSLHLFCVLCDKKKASHTPFILKRRVPEIAYQASQTPTGKLEMLIDDLLKEVPKNWVKMKHD